MKQFPDRRYHPYWDWEEINFNMWGNVKDRSGYLEKAIAFTGDHVLYGAYMIKVTKEWIRSCEHTLSNPGINRKAWLGHAACAIAFGCPEDIVREAWKHLTEQQQIDANKVAQEAIEAWEDSQIDRERIADERRELCLKQG